MPSIFAIAIADVAIRQRFFTTACGSNIKIRGLAIIGFGKGVL